MDVGAQRYHKIANLLQNAVLLGALQVDGDGGSGGLSADGGGVAGNLVADQSEGILLGYCTCHNKLDADIDQVHGDDHQEYLPQDAQNGECLSGGSHVGKGAADVEGQQGDDDHMEHLINNGGEILHTVVEAVTNLLAPHIGQTQPQHEGQSNRGQGIQQWRNG